MLVADELLNRTKNCCLTPTDFLEALVRLADVVEASATLTARAPNNNDAPTTDIDTTNTKDVLDSGVDPDGVFEVWS